LDHPHRIPRDIIVNHHASAVEVETFRKSVGGEHDVKFILLLLRRGIEVPVYLVDCPRGKVSAHDQQSFLENWRELILEVLDCVLILREDHHLAFGFAWFRGLAEDFLHMFNQAVALGVVSHQVHLVELRNDFIEEEQVRVDIGNKLVFFSKFIEFIDTIVLWVISIEQLFAESF